MFELSHDAWWCLIIVFLALERAACNFRPNSDFFPWQASIPSTCWSIIRRTSCWGFHCWPVPTCHRTTSTEPPGRCGISCWTRCPATPWAAWPTPGSASWSPDPTMATWICWKRRCCIFSFINSFNSPFGESIGFFLIHLLWTPGPQIQGDEDENDENDPWLKHPECSKHFTTGLGGGSPLFPSTGVYQDESQVTLVEELLHTIQCLGREIEALVLKSRRFKRKTHQLYFHVFQIVAKYL